MAGTSVYPRVAAAAGSKDLHETGYAEANSATITLMSGNVLTVRGRPDAYRQMISSAAGESGHESHRPILMIRDHPFGVSVHICGDTRHMPVVPELDTRCD
jgi:hypothetical protein